MEVQTAYFPDGIGNAAAAAAAVDDVVVSDGGQCFESTDKRVAVVVHSEQAVSGLRRNADIRLVIPEWMVGLGCDSV